MVSPVTSDRPVAPAMPETHRLIARIRSLVALRSTLILGGRALLVASAISVVAVLLGKFFALPWARSILVAWPILTALALLALFVGIVLGLLRTPRPLAAASMADRFAGPTDHLRAALELSQRTPQDPFVGILLADAERAARACPPAKVVPMRFGRAWPIAALLLAGAVAAAVWVPTRTLDPRRAARTPDPGAPALASEVARVAQEVRAASESVGPAISPRDAERLAELERELLDGSIRTDDARAEAAASAASLADRAEREAEQNRIAADRLREIASAASERAAANPAPDDPSADATAPAPGFDPSEAAEAGTPSNPKPESPTTRSMPDPNVNELMNALSEGDLARAAEAARQLSEQAESLSLEERARIAEQLDALAEAMDQQIPPPEPSSSEATPPAESKPPQSDPSPSPSSAPSPTQPPSQPAAPAPAQPQPAPTPGTAPEPSEAPEDPIEAQADAQESAARDRAESIKQQAERSAERDARSIADAARDAADEMRRPPQPPAPSDQAQDAPQDRPGEQQPRPEQQQGVEQRGAEPQKTGQEQRGDQQRQGSGQRGADQQGTEQQQGSEEQGAARQQTGKEQQGERQQQGSEQQGAEQQQGAKPEQASEQQQDAPQQQGTEQQQGDRPQPGSEQQASEQQQSSEQRGSEQPDSDQPGSEGPGSEQPGAQPQPRPGSGLERLQRTLREASERNADARRQQQAAERLRELSEDLAAGPETLPEPGSQPAPDKREGDNGLARERGTDSPSGGSGLLDSPLTPGPRPSLDRPRTPGEAPTSIENVQGPKPSTPIGSGRAGGERPSDRPAPTEIAPITPSTLREAASGVERAIEQQSVPDRRSDLVRRVFQRYRDRAESASSGSTNPPDRP